MVVFIMWVCFAIGTEVCVVADSTLIASALDIVLLALAEWSVAIDADVASLAVAWSSDWIVKRRKAMAWMDQARILDALGAVVPVWAVKTLVANTKDGLYSVSCCLL